MFSTTVVVFLLTAAAVARVPDYGKDDVKIMESKKMYFRAPLMHIIIYFLSQL